MSRSPRNSIENTSRHAVTGGELTQFFAASQLDTEHHLAVMNTPFIIGCLDATNLIPVRSLDETTGLPQVRPRAELS